LKRLRGLQRGELGKIQHPKGVKGFQPVNLSIDGFSILSQDDIAREVGFPKHTLERAEQIEESNLPKEIKDAAFNRNRLSFPLFLTAYGIKKV
jgi:hypothetical protein